MPQYDLVIRNGRIVTEAEVFTADLAVKDGKICAIGRDLGPGREEIDASGRLVMPGGIDPHCHIEEVSENGTVQEESFITGSQAALAGGDHHLYLLPSAMARPQYRRQRARLRRPRGHLAG